MSLRYIMGRSDTGKTTLCINEIVNCDNMKKRIFYIVPEQFTLESEKNLINKKGSLININVLGFRHFAYYLISKTGTRGKSVLDDTGKAMLIKKIVLEVKDKLGFYKKSADKDGFIEDLCNTITELMQYSISDEKIDYLLESLNEGNLKNKLSDIKIIFNKYREYIKRDYISGDGALDLLAENIKNSVVNGSEVWIDGFKSFTPQENKVIEELIKYCKRVNITFTINSKAKEYGKINPFDEEYEVKRAVNLISNSAVKNNIEIEDITYLEKDRGKHSDEINFIKNNYFKYKFKPYNKEVKNIALYRAKNMYDETERICADIKRLVQYENFRYKDIAVIMGNNSYEKLFLNGFKKYDIPNFLDGRRNGASHPLVVFLKAAVDIIAYNWDNTYIFKLLKTGYTDIEPQRVYAIENYVIANGIDKFKWKREWKYGFREEGKSSSKPEKEYIIETKNMIFDVMAPLSEKFDSNKKALLKDITKELFVIAEKLNITEKIEDELKRAEEKEDNVRAALCRQIWKGVTDTVNKMVEILGDEKVTLKDYSKILSTGLNALTIGIAPPVQDYVIAGDMERTRLPQIKALFVAGANEGNIPVRIVEKGIFTDDERLLMQDKGAELAPRIVQMTNNGRLGIYFNIIKPEKYLVMSYASGSINGANLNPSTVVTRIENMFTELREENISEENININNVITGKGPSFDKMIEAVSLNNNDELIRELYRYYENDKVYGEKLNKIKQGVLSSIPQEYIEDKLLPELWEKVFSRGSVSKLEKFTSCPFKFYMEYILRAKEKEVYRLKSNDVGTLAHRIMEAFSKYIKENNIPWEETKREFTDAFVESHIGNFIKEMNTDIFENNRNSALLGKIKKAAKFALWANTEQVKAGRFKPENFEISFGRYNSEIPAVEIEIDKGKIMKLNGVIDRVDKMLKEDGKVYVKIVDYKSSSKKLDINKIYEGLQLQLVLYMNTIVRKENINPGGMFYFEVNEPKLVDEEKADKNMSAENSMLKRLALNGMYNEEVKEELDSAYYEGTLGRSRAVVKLMRDIEEKESDALSSDNIEELLLYSMEAVKDAGKEMSKGNIKISPYKYGDEDSCKYCPYGTVCDFENGDKKNLRNISKNDGRAWEEIHKRVCDKEKK